MDTSMSMVNDVEQIKRARYMSGKDVNDLVTTKQHVLSLYGPRPPVAVLGAQDGAQGTKGGATIGASASAGYAWHVYQRKLLVWRFQPNEDSKSSPSIAVELLLPKSDLPHNASLVKVFRSKQSSSAVSCLAVSPEGVIRYWDVVSPHASWTDVDGGLGGEEVTCAAHVAPYGVLAVTTSASIILIRPPENASSSVTVRLLSGTQGWLGGLGHRVSTIIFGGSTSANASSHDVDGLESGNKAVKMITVPGLRNGKIEWQIFLFLGLKLQMRIVRDNQSANLEFEVDLEPIFMKHFQARVKSMDSELAILDVKVSEGGLAVLAASSDPRCYLLFGLPIDGSSPPDHAYVLCDLNSRDVDVLERNSGRIANLHFQLLPTTALIYNQRMIVGVPMDGGSGGRGDVLTVPGDGALLGGLVHNGSPTFFNPTYGFIVVQPVDVACFDILTSRQSLATKSSKSTAKSSSHMTDAVKTAFLMYVRQNVTQSRGILAKEFPISRQSQVDSPLSLTLLKFSLDIIHNAPSSDPRWDSAPSGAKLGAVTSSLRIETQLFEKLKAHTMFLDFVHEIIQDRASCKVSRKSHGIADLLHVIVEHNDKLVAAWHLCKLQEEAPQLQQWIDRAVHKAVETSLSNLTSAYPNLSAKDIFYRFVSTVDIGLQSLIVQCGESLQSPNESLQRKRQHLVNTLAIIWEVISAVFKNQRERNYDVHSGPGNWLSKYTGPRAPYEYFKLLFEMVTAMTNQTSPEEERAFYEKLVALTRDLVDVILHLQSTTQPVKRYIALRSWYIRYFIDRDHLLYAKQLAIKFQDMKSLVEITYLLDESDDIPQLIESYGDIGICEEIFNYLLNKGMKADLLNLALSLPAEHKPKLERSLLDGHLDVFWLYKLSEGQPKEAVKSLITYAKSYTANVDKSERMWTLAKLIAKSGGLSDFDGEVDKRLDIVGAQRLLSVGLTRVYDETQIIQMLISPQEDDVGAELLHYKKALELLRWIDEDKVRDRLQNEIWTSAVNLEKSEFEKLKTDSPWSEFSNLLVFRLLELVLSSDESQNSDLVPPFESLNLSDDLETSKRYVYLLRLGWEHINRGSVDN